MYLLYSALAALALLLSSPVWLLRLLRHGKYRAGLGERFGRVPPRLRDPEQRPTIWAHAVSVGEVLAVSGLISELQPLLPSYRIVISTTTMTGQKLARDRFGEANVFYFPVDFAFAVRPYLRALRPDLVIIAETEFWPNFLRLARQSGARIAVVNARISDRSFPRYRRFRALIAPVLRQVDVFLAQGDEDRRRLIAIGAPAERVQVSGNLKFDLKPASETPLVAQFKSVLTGIGQVLVCGSTVEGEESIVLRAFAAVRERFPKALMILAPRHPERFAQVVELVATSGLHSWRRSQWDASQPIGPGILLLDTIGELASTYALADIAFVGGSLVPKGGHNILEAAQHGVAIVVGPHTENFRDMVALFRHADAVVIANADELAPTFLKLLADENRRHDLGARACAILRANSGATARTLAALESLLAERNAPASATSKISPRLET
ncbi:MAG: 3-deoxy-D-manno-octulosonic acid transferase [Acidobacteriia bacterium]|nr:3-deoxy-D-manno-octulosonic acid transferase [Terriglobia bacterium]